MLDSNVSFHDKEILDLEDYKKLEENAKIAFNNIKTVYFEIIPKHKDNSKLKEYYEYALDRLQDIILFSSIYNDRLNVDNGNIEVVNIEEEKQVNLLLPKLNYLLNLYGFDIKLVVSLNEEDNNIRNVIEEDLVNITKEAVNMPKPVVQQEEKPTFNKYNRGPSPFPHKQTKEDKENPNVLVGKLIEDTPVQIKTIVGEYDPITVEGYVFGIDASVRKGQKGTAYIINLKVSDNTDSFLVKFVRFNEDEYNTIVNNVKKNKRINYIFIGI